MSSVERDIKILRRRLQTLRVWVLLKAIIRGISTWLIVSGILLGILFLLGFLFRSKAPMERIPVLFASSISVIFSILIFIKDAWEIRSLRSTARLVEKKWTSLKERLVSCVELWGKIKGSKEEYSAELICALIQDTVAVTDKMHFEGIGKKGIFSSLIFAGFGIFVFWGVANIPFHSEFLKKSLEAEALSYLIVEPGNINLPSGSDLEVKVKVIGKKLGEIKLFYRVENGDWYFKKESGQGVQESRGQGVKNTGELETSFKFMDIQEPIEYYAKMEGIQSEKYRIIPFSLPVLLGLKLKCFFPSYSGIPPLELPENEGDINALVGTRVQITARTNREIQSARLIFSDSTETKLKIIEGKKISGEFRVRADGTYRIELFDTFSVKNSILRSGTTTKDENVTKADESEYRISAIKDEIPEAKILVPGKDTYVPRDMSIPLLIYARDDFGVDSLRLVFQKTGEKTNSLPTLKLRQDGFSTIDTTVQYLWELSSLELSLGDIVNYFVEVFDNDVVSGPKRGVSASFSLKFPTVEEIYQAMEREQEEAIASFKETLPSQKLLREKLEEMVSEIQKSRTFSWEQKKKLEQTLSEQERLLLEMEKTLEQMKEMQSRIAETQLVDSEVLQKMEEVRKLLGEVMTKEMKKALEELKKAMEKLDPKEIEKAMKNFNLTQKELKEKLEKTIALLEQMKVDQKMKEIMKSAKELLERQKELREETEKKKLSSEDERKELSLKQKDLKADVEKLREEIKELAKEMKIADSEVSDSLSNLNREMEKDSLSSNMEKAASHLQRGEKKDAESCQMKAEKSLSKLSAGMQNAQVCKLNKNKKELKEAMRNAMRDLLYLSQEQEELNKNILESEKNPLMDRSALAEREQSLKRGLEKVADDIFKAGQKSLFITPKIGKELGAGIKAMEEAEKSLQRGDSQRRAGEKGKEAVNSLNQAVLSLLESQARMMASQSGSGMEEAMESLSGLSKRQKGVNEGTEGLLPFFGQGLTPSQEEELARLAAEQEAIRQGIESAKKSLSGQESLQERLAKLSDEMKDVTSEMKKKKVDRKLVERQEKLLTRLLDAQRSIRERDFTERRKAEPAKEFVPLDPGTLPSDLGERKKKLREDIQRALKEVYPVEYEELIKEYFKALLEERKMLVK